MAPQAASGQYEYANAKKLSEFYQEQPSRLGIGRAAAGAGRQHIVRISPRRD